jgi:hypothetical protein
MKKFVIALGSLKKKLPKSKCENGFCSISIKENNEQEDGVKDQKIIFDKVIE